MMTCNMYTCISMCMGEVLIVVVICVIVNPCNQMVMSLVKNGFVVQFLLVAGSCHKAIVVIMFVLTCVWCVSVCVCVCVCLCDRVGGGI